MAIFSLVVLSAALFLARAAQTDWVGTYADPTYGGNLAVCVSLVNGVYYGQALISSVGYLRGTIDASNVWTGQYFLAGNAAIRGNFTLTLNGAATAYSGTYQQAGSSDVVYSVTNAAKSSSSTPTDLECFQVDDSMLTTTTTYDLTGALTYDYYVTYWYMSVSDTTLTSSYVYVYQDGTQSPGTSYGTSFLNGQLVLDNWYESADATGIEITLAKNSTHTYNLWWYLPSISNFDYSQQSVDDFGIHVLAKVTTVSQAEIIEESTANVCYALWTESAEQSCLATGGDDDDDDDLNSNLLATAVAFSVVTFVSVVAVLIVVLMRTNSGSSMASKAASPSTTI